MPIITTKDLPEFKTARLVDLTEDSINHIAEEVVSKLNKSVRHGHWIENHEVVDYIKCSECGGAWCTEDNYTETFNYCPHCGSKMDEEKKMPRYIDGDKLKRYYADTAYMFKTHPDDLKLVGPNGNELVEIVRCDNCRYYNINHNYDYCKMGHAGHSGFYCADGRMSESDDIVK